MLVAHGRKREGGGAGELAGDAGEQDAAIAERGHEHDGGERPGELARHGEELQAGVDAAADGIRGDRLFNARAGDFADGGERVV